MHCNIRKYSDLLLPNSPSTMVAPTARPVRSLLSAMKDEGRKLQQQIIHTYPCLLLKEIVTLLFLGPDIDVNDR